MRNIDESSIALGEEVLSINTENKVVITNKREIHYDRLVSTMPLPVLLQKCGMEYPKGVFSCNKVLVFNLGFDSKGTDCVNSWIYVPEKDFIFYRLGYYDNIMASDRMSLYVEIGFSEDYELKKEGLYLERVLSDLRRMKVVTTQKLVDYETVLMKPAYAHISKKSIEVVNAIKKILSDKDIYTIGRYGSWCYCSIEDNILEAKALADMLY